MMNKKIGMSLIVALMVACIGVGYFIGSNSTQIVIYQTIVRPPVTGQVTYWVKRAGTTEFVLVDSNPNIVVTNGLKALRNHLGFANFTYTGTNKTTAISLSSSATSPDASWTIIPSEITTGGLDRVAASSVTVKNETCYNCTHTFTASATLTDVQLSGLSWSDVDSEDNVLFAANQFTATTLYANDQLKIEKETTYASFF